MPCEVYTRLVLYRKDHARAKRRPLYVKIMVYRPFSLAVGRLTHWGPERKYASFTGVTRNDYAYVIEKKKVRKKLRCQGLPSG